MPMTREQIIAIIDLMADPNTRPAAMAMVKPVVAQYGGEVLESMAGRMVEEAHASIKNIVKQGVEAYSQGKGGVKQNPALDVKSAVNQVVKNAFRGMLLGAIEPFLGK